MDVLGNSQEKKFNLFPKKFLERLIKLLMHGKKEYGPTLHCYVVVLFKKKKKKNRGILTVFIIANLYTVLLYSIFELPLGSTFVKVFNIYLPLTSFTYVDQLTTSRKYILVLSSSSDLDWSSWSLLPHFIWWSHDSTLVNSFGVLISGR